MEPEQKTNSPGTRGAALSLDDRATSILVDRAKAGDVEAFERLYRSHVRQVFGLCRRLLDTAQDAEDMTQAIFLRVWRALGRFRGSSRFATWLRRIAVNSVVDERRSGWKKHIVAAADDESELGSQSTASPYSAIDLERAIRQLPPGQRQVLVLFDVEGYSHAEIAALLDVRTGTTKTQLSRARHTLRRLLR